MHYICNLCSYKSVLKVYLELHLKTEHPDIDSSQQIIQRKLTEPFNQNNNLTDFKYISSKKYKCTLTTCKIQYETFKTIDFLKHLNYVHRSDNLICNICNNKYQDMSTFVNHLTIHEMGLFYCLYCSFCSNNPQEIMIHLSIMHSMDPPQLFSRFSITNQSWNIDIAINNDDNNKKSMLSQNNSSTTQSLNNSFYVKSLNFKLNVTLTCLACFHEFINGIDLTRHALQKHPTKLAFKIKILQIENILNEIPSTERQSNLPKKIYFCPYCINLYSSRYDLLLHLLEYISHPQIDKLIVIFIIKLILNLEIYQTLIQEWGNQELACPFCQEICNSKQVALHICNHLFKGAFLCGSCNVTAAFRQKLKKHWNLKHGKDVPNILSPELTQTPNAKGNANAKDLDDSIRVDLLSFWEQSKMASEYDDKEGSSESNADTLTNSEKNADTTLSNTRCVVNEENLAQKPIGVNTPPPNISFLKVPTSDLQNAEVCPSAIIQDNSSSTSAPQNEINTSKKSQKKRKHSKERHEKHKRSRILDSPSPQTPISLNIGQNDGSKTNVAIYKGPLKLKILSRMSAGESSSSQHLSRQAILKKILKKFKIGSKGKIASGKIAKRKESKKKETPEESNAHHDSRTKFRILADEILCSPKEMNTAISHYGKRPVEDDYSKCKVQVPCLINDRHLNTKFPILNCPFNIFPKVVLTDLKFAVFKSDTQL